MACDGTRVFVFGGKLPPDAQSDKIKPIHVLDTSMYLLLFHFIWIILKFENTEHLDFPELDSGVVNPNEKTAQIVPKSSASPPTRGQSHQPSSSSSDAHAAHGDSLVHKTTPEELDNPTSQQITREQNDGCEGSTEHLAKLVAPDAPSGGETARLEDGRLIELERQLSETLVVKTERDRRIAQLTDELALKNALLEQAEANVAAAAEAKKNAELEIRELQAKFDESLLSRDQALEQSQSALQKASCTAEAYERELTTMRAELEASKSESAAFRLRLADIENGCSESKSKAEADTYRTPTATGLVNTDEDRVVHRLLERMQTMEAEIASLRWNEKSFEKMECSNEG